MTNPQAPKGKWRYGVVKKTYVTVLPDSQHQETHYELVEVYDQGKSWTAEPISVSASSQKELVATLQRMINDVNKYNIITIKKKIVHKIGIKA